MLRTPVSTYMTREPDTVDERSTLDEVAARLDSRGISAMPVVDSSARPVGVISRRDLLRSGALEMSAEREVLEWRLPDASAASVMSKQILCVAPGTSVAEAAALMLDNRVHRVFVDDGFVLSGVFTTDDVMRAIVGARIEAPVSRFASRPVCTIAMHEPIGVAQLRLAELGIRGLVVMYEGTPVGVFSEEDALAARHQDAATPVGRVMGHEVLVLRPDVPTHLAAAQMAAMRARRIVLKEGTELVGILTGFDLAGAAAVS